MCLPVPLSRLLGQEPKKNKQFLIGNYLVNSIDLGLVKNGRDKGTIFNITFQVVQGTDQM